MTHRNTWKAAERRCARAFHAERLPLSGAAPQLSKSDSTHPRLYLETKCWARVPLLKVWRKAKEHAAAEKKVPVLCLREKGKEGFWVLCKSTDLQAIAVEMSKKEGVGGVPPTVQLNT